MNKTPLFRVGSKLLLFIILIAFARASYGKEESRESGGFSKLLATTDQHAPVLLSSSVTELPYRLRAGSVDRSVVLSSNFTTGYAWRIISESNAQCATVELINRPSRNATDPAVGVPGQTIVKVHALRPGTTRVELAYGCTWEKGAQYARRLTLNITVIPAS